MTVLKSPNLSLIIRAGLLAGTLDGLAASLNFYISNGKNPIIVFQYIASAVFGKTAYADTIVYGLLGILFHYMVAFGWTILFMFTYPRLSVLRKNVFVTAVLYGLFVWIMMNMIVVPLTRIPVVPITIESALTQASILVVAIGLPLSWLASRYYR